MLKKWDLFIEGLLLFLFAHLTYTYAIINRYGLQLNILLIMPLLVLLMILGKFLIFRAGNKKAYVLIYTIAVLFLLLQAISCQIKFSNPSTLYFLAGIILFSFSDFLLAYNRFVRKFPYSQYYILSTYYLAQLLISLSI